LGDFDEDQFKTLPESAQQWLTHPTLAGKCIMRMAVLAMLVFLLGGGRGSFGADPPANPLDLPDLDGVWLLESTDSGQATLNRLTLTIAAEEFTLHGYYDLDKDWRGFITLAADGNPNHFELKTDEFALGNGTSVVYPATHDLPGILELTGNRVRICFAISEHGKRPETFEEIHRVQELATFVRADPNFTGFPDSVLVTVLDPTSKPAAGAKQKRGHYSL
jgi:uncharacterized protein (TIGR03067 family)